MLFCLLAVSSAVQNILFDVVPFVYFYFRCLSPRRHIQKNIANTDVKMFMPMFSSKKIMILGFIFKYLIHF